MFNRNSVCFLDKHGLTCGVKEEHESSIKGAFQGWKQSASNLIINYDRGPWTSGQVSMGVLQFESKS
jgi:hypothetical protein